MIYMILFLISFSLTYFIKEYAIKKSLIAKNLDKKIYLIKIPFFETLLKVAKPSFHKRLYGSLEVDNTITKEKLNLKNPYSVEEGIGLMLNGEF